MHYTQLQNKSVPFLILCNSLDVCVLIPPNCALKLVKGSVKDN